MGIGQPVPRVDALGGGAERGDPSHPANATTIPTVERLIEELNVAWERGERPRAEEILDRHPELSEEDAAQLVYEEASLRLDDGPEFLSAEFYQRFPKWRSRLGLLIECKRLLNASPRIDFPEVGEDLGDFHLVAELGRGAAGRTFLASERSLAGRVVVLKVVSVDRDEHLSLARLQHMNIVPLYFERAVPDRGVRVLGMPWLGGTSLAQLLRSLAEIPVVDRSGVDLVRALEQNAAAIAEERRAYGPYRKYLARASFVHAICWIGASLADALQYAHERNLVHLDVKPSNVLIAEDGQPMLLDFHLAREPVSPGQSLPDRLGGTSGYMSPEQRLAMDALERGQSLTVTINGRSDIYSLGVLLHESLGGDALAPNIDGPRERPLHECNPSVSRGLSDIIQKCMAADPSVRYADAASLALDLRRHLNDLPLQGVANRSVIERWRKWRCRSPWASVRGLWEIAAVVAVLIASIVGVAVLRQRDHQVSAALADGTNHLRRGRVTEARDSANRGLEMLAALPWPKDRRSRAFHQLLQRVAWLETAAELRETVDLLRFRQGVDAPPADVARELFLRGLPVWQARDQIMGSFGDPRAIEETRGDLMDLAMILAALRARWVDDEQSSAYPTALEILQDATVRFGTSSALTRDLAIHASASGRSELSAAPVAAPRTAWEHYDLARSLLRIGDHAAAERELRQSIEIRPQEFWPHYYHGLCCYRLGRFQDAVASISTSIALAPKTAECYYNRSLAYQALDQRDDALRDLSRALELRPTFPDAALNRGILRLHDHRPTEALRDFALAGASTSNPKWLGLIRYNEALAHLAQNDATAADVCLDQAIALGDADARRLRDQLRARSK
jgi:serine/threonine protein kinase/Flp pilus assembly protein TadD